MELCDERRGDLVLYVLEFLVRQRVRFLFRVEVYFDTDDESGVGCCNVEQFSEMPQSGSQRDHELKLLRFFQR